MGERAQASIETIALLAAVMAVAAGLLVAAAVLGPRLATSIGHALSGASGPGTPTAPALDRRESLLFDGATSTGPDGPTLLDLRTQLRSRLGTRPADAALDTILRRLVSRTLAEQVLSERCPAGIDGRRTRGCASVSTRGCSADSENSPPE